jgi:glycosyltransferase involved in cell wall biosynthesis
MNKLSLLIPSFNDERILAILSELQDYPRCDLEIVIQDGGSRRDMISKMRALLRDEDHLIIENDDGIFDGINKGITNCSNQFILTIGSDDFVDSSALDQIIQRLRSGSEKIFFLPVRMVEPTSLRLIRYWPVRKFSRLRIFLGTQYPHFGLVAHKDIYAQLKFNITNKINADYEFFYDLSKLVRPSAVGYIKSCSVMMRLGGTSTKNLSSIISHQFIMISYALKKNPILLIGLGLKPIYKIQEIIIGFLKR